MKIKIKWKSEKEDSETMVTEIWGSHSMDYKYYYILWDVTACNVVDVYRCVTRYTLPPFSRSISKPSNNLTCCLLPAWLLGLPFEPEDGGNTLLRKSMSSIRLNRVISQKITVFLVGSFLAYFPYFEEIKKAYEIAQLSDFVHPLIF
jgi:hypothetical protein